MNGDDRQVDWRVVRVGEAIATDEVRLIAADGTQVGVVETAEALRMAQSAGLDLVELNPRATPPVCKIMDYRALRDSFVRNAGG